MQINTNNVNKARAHVQPTGGKDESQRESQHRTRVRVMVFNATFSNISVISWRLVLLVEEIGVPRENHYYVYTGIFHVKTRKVG